MINAHFNQATLAVAPRGWGWRVKLSQRNVVWGGRGGRGGGGGGHRARGATVSIPDIAQAVPKFRGAGAPRLRLQMGYPVNALSRTNEKVKWGGGGVPAKSFVGLKTARSVFISTESREVGTPVSAKGGGGGGGLLGGGGGGADSGRWDKAGGWVLWWGGGGGCVLVWWGLLR